MEKSKTSSGCLPGPEDTRGSPRRRAVGLRLPCWVRTMCPTFGKRGPSVPNYIELWRVVRLRAGCFSGSSACSKLAFVCLSVSVLLSLCLCLAGADRCLRPRTSCIGAFDAGAGRCARPLTHCIGSFRAGAGRCSPPHSLNWLQCAASLRGASRSAPCAAARASCRYLCRRRANSSTTRRKLSLIVSSTVLSKLPNDTAFRSNACVEGCVCV